MTGWSAILRLYISLQLHSPGLFLCESRTDWHILELLDASLWSRRISTTAEMHCGEWRCWTGSAGKGNIVEMLGLSRLLPYPLDAAGNSTGTATDTNSCARGLRPCLEVKRDSPLPWPFLDLRRAHTYNDGTTRYRRTNSQKQMSISDRKYCIFVFIITFYAFLSFFAHH